MGLFSGDFGSGLVEGLAESVDQSLKSAMEKREKELSRAREFWMTRQAQKMDLADDHDKRAGDALDAFITEFNGDVAKGLAAYKHFKTVDGAEAGLKEIEDSRAALGQFDVNDYFSFEGIDLGQFADLSREDAFASIRAEVKPLDIQMQDTGLLSKIGLGDSDMGGKVSSQINELIPARTRTAIKGLLVQRLIALVQSQASHRSRLSKAIFCVVKTDCSSFLGILHQNKMALVIP